MYIIVVAVLLVGLAWFIAPYLKWHWLKSQEAGGRALEAHVGKTSWQFPPGELVAPPGKAPTVALSVVVPAYNEEYRLPEMLDEALNYLDSRVAASPSDFSYEVLVVDDGSSDNTFDAALGSRSRECRGEVRVMQLSANRGKGFAVKAGMLVARGRLLLMADADGATSFRDLERLEQALGKADSEGAAQIAFGSRHHLKDQALAKRSFIRNLLMVGFHCAVWLLVGGTIHDTQCGFKLFRANTGKLIFQSLHLQRWAFDIEVLILARFLGRPIVEVPVTWNEMPGSKLNLVVDAVTMLRDIALLQALYKLGVWQPATGVV